MKKIKREIFDVPILFCRKTQRYRVYGTWYNSLEYETSRQNIEADGEVVYTFCPKDGICSICKEVNKKKSINLEGV